MTTTIVQTPLDKASCWLCLEEGPDIFGEPLVRNCSCRGNSGFAHISCLINYAESFSNKALLSDDVIESLSSFTVCTICRQDYQNNVAYELSAAAVKFIEREFTSDQHVHVYIDALMCRLAQLKVEIVNDRYEGEAIVIKILDVLDKLKHSHDGHRLSSSNEGHAHATIATFFHQIGSNDCLQKAKFHFQTAKSMFEMERNEQMERNELSMMMIDKLLDDIEVKICGEVHQCHSHDSDVKLCTKRYALFTKEFGAEDDMTITAGTKLAETLSMACKTSEAKRLLVELVEMSGRVHGSEHECTRCATLALQQM